MAILTTIAAGLGAARAAKGLYDSFRNKGGGRGGGNVRPGVQRMSEEQMRRRQAILERLAGQAGASPTETGVFQAGLGELQFQQGQQQQADRAALARSGATGGEAELATRSNRAQAFAGALPQLIGLGARQRQAAQGQLLTATGQDIDRANADYWRRRQQKARKRGQILGALGQAANAAASVYANRPQGGGS